MKLFHNMIGICYSWVFMIYYTVGRSTASVGEGWSHAVAQSFQPGLLVIHEKSEIKLIEFPNDLRYLD